jgi:hypothetical protein
MQPAQAQSLSPTLRTGTIDDAEECGRIMFEAFRTIGPPDFPSVEVATLAARMLLSHPGFYSVVAELGGRVAGSNFLDERSPIAGVGPITVDPPAMNRSIGRQLMVAVMDRAEQLRVPGVRLVQTELVRSLAVRIHLASWRYQKCRWTNCSCWNYLPGLCPAGMCLPPFKLHRLPDGACGWQIGLERDW